MVIYASVYLPSFAMFLWWVYPTLEPKLRRLPGIRKQILVLTIAAA